MPFVMLPAIGGRQSGLGGGGARAEGVIVAPGLRGAWGAKPEAAALGSRRGGRHEGAGKRGRGGKRGAAQLQQQQQQQQQQQAWQELQAEAAAQADAAQQTSASDEDDAWMANVGRPGIVDVDLSRPSGKGAYKARGPAEAAAAAWMADCVQHLHHWTLFECWRSLQSSETHRCVV